MALIITLLRTWIRLCTERRTLTVSDYLVWAGWFCSLGWVICSIVALRIQHDRPLQGEELYTDSVEYLKVRER